MIIIQYFGMFPHPLYCIGMHSNNLSCDVVNIFTGEGLSMIDREVFIA